MSYEAMYKIRASGLVDRTQVDVLEALAFFQNSDSGACFPSTEAIARVSRVNDRLVRTTLKKLHDLGYVSSEQQSGQRRYFTLHLDRLPEPVNETTPLNKTTPLYETAPLHESTGEGCRKVQGTPVGKCRGPLYKTTAESVIEQVINKEGNREGSVPSEWTSPEYQGTSPEKQDTVPQKKGRGSPEKRGEGSPKNRDVTGNRNREIEQGIGTGSAAPSPDHFPDATKKVEEPKPKATRAKPKTSCPFSPDDPIPPEYLEYAQAKHPSINAQAEFTKFVNFHLSKDNRYSNWLAAWRTWATKEEEFAKSRPQSQSYAQRNNKPLIFDDAYYGDGSF